MLKEAINVVDVAGNPLIDLPLFDVENTTQAMQRLKKSKPLPVVNRYDAFLKAAKLFSTASLNGLSVEAYEEAVSRASGLPLTVVQQSTKTMQYRLEKIFTSIDAARPNGAVFDWQQPLVIGGRAVWARRGDVLAVHAVGNHPGTHTIWPEALACGYRVAVRPTRREPFTPLRLVAALHAAGFTEDHVCVLPTDTEAAEIIYQQADFAYGGDDIIRKYTGQQKTLALKPGRSKILITADVNWEDYLDVIVDSIAHHSGTGCVNATAILVEDNHHAVAEAIKSRLEKLPNHHPQDINAVLPVQPLQAAKQLASYLNTRSIGARMLLGGNDIYHDLGNGSAVMRPAVHEVADPYASQLNLELPFPCVWVAPWSQQDGIEPLLDSLVVTVMSHNKKLAEQCINTPSISNVYSGYCPTYWTDIGMPHDDYLTTSLMMSKSFKRVNKRT